MMLSFSVPKMRPYVEAGLRERAITGFPRPYNLPVSGERVKRQSIRHRGPVWQRMIGEAKDGRVERDLHLWWKSRTKERALLGVVRGFEIEAISIEHRGGNCLIHRPMSTAAARADGFSPVLPGFERMLAHKFAWADGFEDFASFVSYFVPKPGDRFVGALIKW